MQAAVGNLAVAQVQVETHSTLFSWAGCFCCSVLHRMALKAVPGLGPSVMQMQVISLRSKAVSAAPAAPHVAHGGFH